MGQLQGVTQHWIESEKAIKNMDAAEKQRKREKQTVDVES